MYLRIKIKVTHSPEKKKTRSPARDDTNKTKLASSKITCCYHELNQKNEPIIELVCFNKQSWGLYLGREKRFNCCTSIMQPCLAQYDYGSANY